MAHLVLVLPDTLSIIFRHLQYDSLSLAQCLRVNKTWFAEAVRVLWSRCETGRWPPLSPKHLAALSQDKCRQQLYANQIQHLQFGYELQSSVIRDPAHSDAHFHAGFVNVAFPRLKTLELYGANASHENQFRMIRQYLQSRLESFQIHDGLLSPEMLFFAQVCHQSEPISLSNLQQEHCPRITVLYLHVPYICGNEPSAANMGESAFISLLKSLPCLMEFSASENFFGEWVTQASFRTLSKCPNLRYIGLPLQKHEVQKSLINISTIIFPSIDSARFSCRESDFEAICSKLPDIVELTLSVQGPFASIFRLCARFVTLRQLYVFYNDATLCTVEASDLLELAEECQQLEELSVTCHNGLLADGEGITDDIIRRLAKKLPYLKILNLDLVDTNLTEESLLSLGRCCPCLVDCTIPAVMSIRNLIDGSSPDFFPMLESLDVQLVLEQDSSDCDDFDEALVKEIIIIAPVLERISVGDDAYNIFRAAHDKIKRNQP